MVLHFGCVRPSVHLYHSIILRIGSFFKYFARIYFAGRWSTQNWRSRFFWKNSCLLESRPNLFQDWLISFFLYFAWSWETISTHNWRSRIFWRNSLFCKNWPKRPKMAWFVYYGSIFSQDWLIRFVSCFAWSWGTINREI